MIFSSKIFWETAAGGLFFAGGGWWGSLAWRGAGWGGPGVAPVGPGGGSWWGRSFHLIFGFEGSGFDEVPGEEGQQNGDESGKQQGGEGTRGVQDIEDDL